MNLKRPEVDAEIIKKAAVLTAKSVSNASEQEKANLAASIAEVYSPHMNGYELAKALENSGSWWGVDTMFVEEMDQMSDNIDDIHLEICQQWVKDNNIQPELPIGTLIKEGEITGVCDYNPAKYLVKVYGHDDVRDGESRRLVDFEDAMPIEASASSVIQGIATKDENGEIARFLIRQEDRYDRSL